MAAKRFSGKWTVRQTIIKKHFIVCAYECIASLQSTLPLQLTKFLLVLGFFSTLEPINLIFIQPFVNILLKAGECIYDLSVIKYLIYLNFSSHLINKIY